MRSDLEALVARFAAKAHLGQVRKYVAAPEMVPYIFHPAAVADIVRDFGGTESMICAAWLHDVVEDTPVTLADIDREFTRESGHGIAELVGWLTDVARPSDGNRKARVKLNREHSWAAPVEAQVCKVADCIHNTYRIYVLAPKFAPIFMAEIKELMGGLDKVDPKIKQVWYDMTGTDADDFKYEVASPETRQLIGSLTGP